MNEKDNLGVVRTPLGLVAAAWIVGLLAAFFAGNSILEETAREVDFQTALIRGIIIGVTSGVLVASLVGLGGLLSGAELGRYFSYPFSATLGACIAIFLISWTKPIHESNETSRVGLIWFTGIIMGIVCGAILAMRPGGYRRWARGGAGIGAGAMFLIGAYLVKAATGRHNSHHTGTILIATLSFTVFGGALGAVIGAFGDNAARHKAEDNVAVDQ
jgi:hypothetical protein